MTLALAQVSCAITMKVKRRKFSTDSQVAIVQIRAN